jgi:hypothetical protein
MLWLGALCKQKEDMRHFLHAAIYCTRLKREDAAKQGLITGGGDNNDVPEIKFGRPNWSEIINNEVHQIKTK